MIMNAISLFTSVLILGIFLTSAQPPHEAEKMPESSGDQACTAFRINTTDGDIILGRSMEFVIDMKSNVTLVPIGYQYVGTAPEGKPGLSWKTKHGILGMSTFGLPHFSEGMNDAGLAVSALWLPEFTDYPDLSPENYSYALAPGELVAWALGSFETVDEFKEALPGVHVWNAPLPDGSFTPLHYIVYDARGDCVVVEYVGGELNIYDNPLGVMTNAPPFSWHIINLQNFVNLRPLSVTSENIAGINLTGIGQGTGMLGMPGDYTPPSRFIRAVALTQSAYSPKNAQEGANLAWHILNAFDITKGVVRGRTSDGAIQSDYTMWTTVKDITNRIFYYRTYDNLSIKKVDLKTLDFLGDEIKNIPLDGKDEFEDVSQQFR
jgi:choloylglycine hydrolase